MNLSAKNLYVVWVDTVSSFWGLQPDALEPQLHYLFSLFYFKGKIFN